jgi:uncharacterized Zn finger protein (UPF0148 family)
MDTVRFNKGGKPVCPNHGCPLDCGFPMPTTGQGVCPVSGYKFEFSAEVDEEVMVQDKDGNITKGKKWKVVGQD